MLFGIWRVEKDKTPPIDTFFTQGKHAGYAFHACGNITSVDTGFSSAKTYGKVCKKGSIIQIVLDMELLQLSFIIDGVDYGKAFDVKAGEYRAAVWLQHAQSCVKLLNDNDQ